MGFLDYDVEIRKITCSANAVESLNAHHRRAARAPARPAGFGREIGVAGDQNVGLQLVAHRRADAKWRGVRAFRAIRTEHRCSCP